MARVRILGTGVSVVLAPGQRLLDALDESGKPAIRTACRAGNCGICRMRVLTGDYQLRAPSAREHTTLMQLKAAPDERLGCQIVLENEGPEVLLQPISFG
jgi:adenylate cyclase